ncbi:MAG: MFS transporter [Thermodesulfobacteriota bacterium]
MQDSLGKTVLRYRWLIFGIMAVAYLSAFFHRVSPAVIALDVQESLGISAGMVGLLASAYFYSYAAIQFPAGLLSDSLGPRKAVTIFLLVGALGSVFFGLAPTLEIAVFGRILVGLGAGMVFAPTMKILSAWFRVNEFMRANGLFLAMGGVGALSAATPLALITGSVGWRTSFVIIGIATVALSLLVWVFVRNRPEELGWPSLADLDPVYGKSLAPPKEIPLWAGVRRVIGEKYFWAVAAWATCSMGVFFAFGGLWAGPYLMHIYGMTREEAGGILNMFAVGIVVGSPSVAYLSERIFHSRKNVLRAASLALLGVLGVLYLAPSGIPVPGLYILFFLLSASALAPGVISITTTKELFPIEITGTSIGTVNLFPFVGGAVLQILAGVLLDSFGKSQSGTYSLEAYHAMLLSLLLVAFVALVSTFLMKETYPEAAPGKRL